MIGLEFLDLVIGLIFIYLIYSIACSTLWEIIVNFTYLRGKMLRKWFLRTFDEKVDKEKLGEKIFKHPLIRGLSKSKKKLPGYISSRLFSDVLTDLVVNSSREKDESPFHPVDINTFREKLEKTAIIPDGLKSVFLQYVADASGNLQVVKDRIGKWYENAQDRLIGSYKKYLQRWIFAIALVLVGLTNADTFTFATFLFNNAHTRKILADKAELYLRDSAIIDRVAEISSFHVDSVALQEQEAIVAGMEKNVNNLKELNEELKETGIPVGWGKETFESPKLWGIIKKIGGLLLTAFAVSLGAPFWFDLLGKLSNLRSSGNRPENIPAPEGKNGKE